MHLLHAIRPLATRRNITAVLALLGLLVGTTLNPVATELLVEVIPTVIDVLDAAT